MDIAKSRLTSIVRGVLVLAAGGLGGPALAQTSGPATRPTTDGKAATMAIRLLVDRTGLPDQKPSIDHLLEMASPNDAPQVIKDSATWVKANRASIEGVKPGPLTATPWGRSTVQPGQGDQPTKLYLHVFEWHASGKVIAYGLSGQNVSRAYLLADPKKDLKFEKTVRDVIVEVAPKSAKAPNAIDTVVVLEIKGEPAIVPLAVSQSADHSVLLHAKDSIVVGRNLRYEPEPIKNTVGYWTNPDDWVYWEFDLNQAGAFDIEILQGCGKGSGGSEVEVTLDKQAFPVVVQDTGGFQAFVPRIIGNAKLDAGKHRLEVKVKQKKGGAVMDLRQVMLKPAEAEK